MALVLLNLITCAVMERWLEQEHEDAGCVTEFWRYTWNVSVLMMVLCVQSAIRR